MPPRLVVAIDGPAGSGKSSVSKAVAARLGLEYLDTGAMYRAVTWAVLDAGIDPEDAVSVAALMSGNELPRLRSGTNPLAPTIEVGDVDVSGPIRGEGVTSHVSAVSAVPEVRQRLVDLQRHYVDSSSTGIVVEGRDIGSVVLPNANCKVFLTADSNVRALRRAAETDSVERSSLASTENAIRARDAKDSSRKVSPLVRADGAVEVDTTSMTFEEVVDAVVRLVEDATR